MKPSRAPVVEEKAKCQRCLKAGHWTADCKSPPVYKSRPTRTALLKNPTLKLPEVLLPEKVPVAEILGQQPNEESSSSSESELSYHSSDFDSVDDDEEGELLAKEADLAEEEAKSQAEATLSESDFSSEAEEEPAEKRIKRD